MTNPKKPKRFHVTVDHTTSKYGSRAALTRYCYKNNLEAHSISNIHDQITIPTSELAKKISKDLSNLSITCYID